MQPYFPCPSPSSVQQHRLAAFSLPLLARSLLQAALTMPTALPSTALLGQSGTRALGRRTHISNHIPGDAASSTHPQASGGTGSSAASLGFLQGPAAGKVTSLPCPPMEQGARSPSPESQAGGRSHHGSRAGIDARPGYHWCGQEDTAFTPHPPDTSLSQLTPRMVWGGGDPYALVLLAQEIVPGSLG